MSNGNKVILSIVLLIAAAGILTWHFKSSKTSQPPEPDSIVLNTPQAQALESIFKKVGTKKWSDPSLWSSPKAASAYGKLAEKLFTATPSMDNVKILNYGANKENDDALALILEVPASEMCIQIEFKSNHSGQQVIDFVKESDVTAKAYRNR